MFSWIGIINFHKMTILPKAIYRFNACMLSCFSHVRIPVTLRTVALPGSSVHGIFQVKIQAVLSFLSPGSMQFLSNFQCHFHRTRTSNFKIIRKHKRPLIDKTILRKNTAGGIRLPVFKLLSIQS